MCSELKIMEYYKSTYSCSIAYACQNGVSHKIIQYFLLNQCHIFFNCNDVNIWGLKCQQNTKWDINNLLNKIALDKIIIT